MAKKRTVFLPNGDPAFVDKALLKKYPFLERMRGVTTLVNRRSGWQITPKQAEDLEYSGYKVQLSYDGKGRIDGLGLLPEKVQVKTGKVIKTGNEYWVSDMTLLDKTLISESKAKRLYDISYHHWFKVYVDGKKKSSRYAEMATLKGKKRSEPANTLQKRMIARYGLENLPPRWKHATERDLATHFQIKERVQKGELVAENDVPLPFTFLEDYERDQFVGILSVERCNDPVTFQSYYSPKTDLERLKSEKVIKAIFEGCGHELFFFLYLFNKMGNDFLEILAGELKENHEVDFHEFM